MAKKIGVAYDFLGFEIQNVLAHLVAGDPGSPAEGQFWYDSSAKKLKYRTNTATIDPTARGNHTGTQLASTISDLMTAVVTARLDQMAAPTAAVSMNGQRVTAVGTPTAATDAATKGYVDATVQGMDWKPSARAASTGNVSIAAPGAAIDGVTLAANDRVLLTAQTAPAENGVWVWNGAATAMTRPADFTAGTVSAGAVVPVTEGTANGDKAFILTTNDPITVGTSALAFTVLPGAAQVFVAGAGLTLTGSTFDVGAGSGIIVNADNVAVDPAVVTRKFSQDCAAAITTTVNHNLGTRDVQVRIYRNTTPWDDIEVEVERPDANNVVVRFGVAPAAAAYRIVVQG